MKLYRTTFGQGPDLLILHGISVLEEIGRRSPEKSMGLITGRGFRISVIMVEVLMTRVFHSQKWLMTYSS